MTDYKQKYLKYKAKYLLAKQMIGGSGRMTARDLNKKFAISYVFFNRLSLFINVTKMVTLIK